MKYSDISCELTDWKDYPSTSTKLNAENLNKPNTAIQKIITAIAELRVLLGTEDLDERVTTIIAGINGVYEQLGGYNGYNLVNMNLLEAISTGYQIEIAVDGSLLTAGSSYTFSYEGDADVYLYEYDSSDTMLSTEILSETASVTSFTLPSDCAKVTIVFLKTDGYTSVETCNNAHVMLEAGTEKHNYEPYTAGEAMLNLLEEILQNRYSLWEHDSLLSSHSTAINGHALALSNQSSILQGCVTRLTACEEFIDSLSEALEGAY